MQPRVTGCRVKHGQRVEVDRKRAAPRVRVARGWPGGGGRRWGVGCGTDGGRTSGTGCGRWDGRKRDRRWAVVDSAWGSGVWRLTETGLSAPEERREGGDGRERVEMAASDGKGRHGKGDGRSEVMVVEEAGSEVDRGQPGRVEVVGGDDLAGVVVVVVGGGVIGCEGESRVGFRSPLGNREEELRRRRRTGQEEEKKNKGSRTIRQGKEEEREEGNRGSNREGEGRRSEKMKGLIFIHR